MSTTIAGAQGAIRFDNENHSVYSDHYAYVGLGDGDNQLQLDQGGNVRADGGNDTITMGVGSLNLLTYGTAEVSMAGGGQVTMDGTMKIVNGEGANTFISYGGTSTMVGSAGEMDTFQFNTFNVNENALIQGFEQGMDKLILPGNSFEDLQNQGAISVADGNTTIHLGSTFVELVGITSLTASDFSKY